MLGTLPRSCLVHPVDRFDSEGWFRSDQVIFLTMRCVVYGKKSMQQLSEKTQFRGCLFPQVVQKHYLGEVGNKACFDCLLSRQHLCQKLLQSNRVRKDYSKSNVGRFSETVYIYIYTQ